MGVCASNRRQLRGGKIELRDFGAQDSVLALNYCQRLNLTSNKIIPLSTNGAKDYFCVEI